MDKTGRILIERNQVMEEMRNYFQELTEENTIVTEEKDLTISDEIGEEIECLTHIEVK